MNIDEQKSSFNDWVKTFCDYEDLSVYELDIMQAAWIASANRGGYKLVPLEATREMINAGIRRQWDEYHIQWSACIL